LERQALAHQRLDSIAALFRCCLGFRFDGLFACVPILSYVGCIFAVGHTVRLMAPRYVKPYVKRRKNDAADAEAICEAVTRPSMRLVEIKTREQQGTLVLHRVRLLLMRQGVASAYASRGGLRGKKH
jgi:transposase